MERSYHHRHYCHHCHHHRHCYNSIYVQILILVNTFIMTMPLISTEVNSSIIDSSMTPTEKLEEFEGRISKINKETAILRIKVNFKNKKFLNKEDKIEIWSARTLFSIKSSHSAYRCSSALLAKSTAYLLLQVNEIDKCIKRTQLSVGSPVLMSSKNLANNIRLAHEVIETLVKKKGALKIKLDREKKELDDYMNRVESLSNKYEVLRIKLENELQEELSALENDKNNTKNKHSQLQRDLMEVEHKLEEYSISDKNIEEDRWALDSRIFINK
ncbi:MAG: hypothetical protein HQK53_09900 [Oligoflexia bacterium]|nr:hypothetical protein [Oligoflexia bacterium]